MTKAQDCHKVTSTSSSTPEVSVIVVNYNGRHHLERCLPSLAATTGVSFETILVDNGSQDDSVPWVREHFPEVKVVQLKKNLGFGAANHVGIAQARASLVALLNNDTVVDPGWLAVLVEALQGEPEAVAACSTLRLLQWPELYNARGGGVSRLGYGFDRSFGYPCLLQGVPEVEPAAFPTAAAALFRKAEFLAIGGFDPSFFMYHEDVDFGLRAWMLGKKILLCRDSVVWHAYGGGNSGEAGERRRYLFGSRHLIRTNIKCMDLYELMKSLWHLSKVWYRQGAWGLLAHVAWWNLWRLPSTFRARWALQRRRAKSYSQLATMGLIDPAPFPPEYPRLPRLAPAETLLVSSILLPGRDSSRGRLGFGWNRIPKAFGEPFGVTRGAAQCFLRLPPNARGTLAITLRRALPETPDGDVQITVNGQCHSRPIPQEGFGTVEVPAIADENGMVEVVLQAPEAIPHTTRKNWDFTPQALAVAQLRFVAEIATPTRPRPTVSVVIPTYNRWQVLKLTLRALTKQEVPPDQVVVVDDGSTDGTFEKLRRWQTTFSVPWELLVLRQENRGPAAARNYGLQYATGTWVVFMGDDTIPEPDFLAAHIKAQQRLEGPCAVVGLTLWDRQRQRVTPFLEYVNRAGDQFAYGLFDNGDELPFTCFYTSNISLPRTVLGENPFHEGFRYAAWEDAELGYRLSLRGLRIVLCTEAITWHLHPLSLSTFLKRQERVGEALATLLQLHPELASDPAIPPARRPKLARAFRVVGPVLVPFAHFLDQQGLPLPQKLYRGLLLAAFYRGRQKSQAC